MRLPDIPTVAPDALERHDDARRLLREQLAAAPAPVARLLHRVQRRILLESIAGITPIICARVAPPRRRFLSASARDRRRGCELAVEHVEAWHRASPPDLVGTSTVVAVHALVCSQGHAPGAGLFRTGDVHFDATETDYAPPRAAQCAELLDAAIGIVDTHQAAAVVRAGWFTAALLAIHPFVDGNGRTARVLHHLVASSDEGLGVDLGTAEVWSIARDAYVAALKASQRAAGPDGIDVSPFVAFAVESATVGAERVSRRLTAMSELWGATWDSPSEDARLVEIAVALDSTATIDELGDLVAASSRSAIVDDLVDRGRLRWDGTGRLRLAGEPPMFR